MSLVAYTTLSIILVDRAQASNTGLDFELDGIGYREQALQQAKTSFFQSETPNGVLYASFNGGTNIFIKGPNLNDNPAANVIWFESVEFSGVKLPAPTLTEDDSFNSNPLLGFITYRVPSVHELFGADSSAFDTNDYLNFYISVKADDVFGEERDMECTSREKCRIQFQKSYTPVVFYLSPPVIYYDAFTELWFDPKHTQRVMQNLKSDEMLFVNTEIGGSKLDFEGIVDYQTTFSWWTDNRVKGLVGEMPVGRKNDIKMLWEVGYAMVSETESLHCSYDNSTCYKALNVPVIFNISSNVGYTSGHQNLTIHGHGFDSDNITVTVDGVNCTVTNYQAESVSCEVQPKSAPSDANSSAFVGSNGIRRQFWNHTNYGQNTWGNMERYENTGEYLATSFEVPTNQWHKVGQKLYGWFIAPETTSYRFHLSCDDICDLNMGLNESDPLNTTLIVSRRSASSHRKHFTLINDAVSGWVNLTKGEAYYMYAKHEERWGNDHFAVGVEINQTNMTNHHHAMKEIQYIEARPEGEDHEVTRITVTNPALGGKYYLSMQIPANLSYWTSPAIEVDSTAAELKSKIEKYYRSVYGSWLDVNLTMYDSNGTNTTNVTEAVSYVYHVVMQKFISGSSVSNIMISKQSQATIAIEQPKDVQLSSEPLSGKFRITCPIEGNDVAAEPIQTDDIKLSESWRWIQQAIFRKCAGTYDRLEVWEATDKFRYRQNGIGLYIRFIGSNGPQTQMRIISGVDSPLPETGVIYNQSRPVAASTNLFFEAIPFEMLRTYETEPQVLVHVGEFPAVCHNLTCDFHYTIPEGNVTNFTYTASTKVLELTGVNLPANKSLIRHVEFAHSFCTIDESTVSNSSLTCTLDHEPVCGDWLPMLVANEGLVNTSSALVPETITCTVSSVVPTTQLNLLGGDNLTISGTQLPWDMKRSNVSLTFNDAQSTNCIPQESTSATLVCLTEAFDKAVAAGQTVPMSIQINNQTVTNSLSLTTMSTTKAGILVTPPSANPTLKTKINITLESDFPYTLDKNDFSVNATNISNPTYFRQMNVIAVDDSTKTLTCMFGGAWSGLYQLSLRHKEFGLLETVGITLTVGSNATAISPNTGSIYGGTLITITGNNFGSEFTDNPVQISTLGAVGSVDCYLQAIQETEIKCRLDKTNKTDGLSGKVITFLKTSEEAACVPDGACGWNYVSAIPEVNNMTTEWDSANSYWTVVVNGTGFTGTTDTTELHVNGRKQTTVSLNGTQAVFRIVDIDGWTLSNINLYFDVGLPQGYDTIIEGKTFTLGPKMTSITSNAGSLGGSIIIAQVEGVGPLSDSSSANWAANGVDLVDSTSQSSICQSVKLTSYGVVECTTITGVINSATIAAKSLKDQTVENCSNTDTTLCTYQQLDDNSFPDVVSVASSVAGQIVFEGNNFFTSGHTANASYAGIYADQISIESSSKATATWTLGFPPLGVEIAPQLWFDPTGTAVRHYANTSSTIAKALNLASGYTGQTCSFSGGCNIQIDSEGLSTILKNDSTNNFISVCEEKCEFLSDLSDSTKAVCKLPKMSTVYSNENFKIEKEREDLRFRKTFGNIDDVSTVFDSNLMILAKKSSSESTCIFGGSFKADHVGMLSQVKYFMGEIQDKTLFVDKLTFQGSPDNSTWTDLFQPDENIHEGWNYYKWEESTDFPRYRFYRFYSSESNGCLVTEVRMTGVETVDDTADTYSCSVALEMNDAVVQTLADQVTYQGSLTPLLTTVEPRYGPVTGGTSITFSGTNFATDTTKYTIIIDGRTCAVTAATTTSVTCTADHRPGLISPSLEIYIDGMGLVSNQEKLFRYVSYWSDDTTWGGEFAPLYLESVYVPEGLNLYVDVDKTPELKLVMVEGSLIFAPHTDPNHERYFDANYIFLNQGYMEVGTEEHPYTSKLTITMHGNISSPYLPIFGNKCIAVKESTLDMHGIKREPTWTVMNETSLPGATEIKLTGQVDWVAGEEIAIAPTGFNPREGEKRIIAAIDKSNPDIPVVTLDAPLDYKHFAMIQYYGDDFIDMRAEVGLLTRNVKYRGDPETSAPNQYGATIFLHSEGDDSLIARLEYVELTDVGQAFKIGRYAVHFHMIGAVHKSYCRGFGTHQSFNRAFTLHGTHYMRLINNVAYNVKGHVVFIEDAVEKKNLIQGNCIIMAKRSWSLLNTDQTPACYWITSPDNAFIENRCGGSDRYGFWYDLQVHAIGPHANTNVCPENERVGEFRDNAAHSCGRYGFRIFHNMIPRKYPCKPIEYDPNNATDPWHKNPPITAHFDGFTGWKNGRNGAISTRIGDVRFHNFKVADNRLGGIEFGQTDYYGDNTTRVNNSLIIGRTNNTEQILDSSEPFGIIGPRTDNLRVDNCRFFNFDWKETAAISTCSHCWHDQETDSGGRTVRFNNMTFDSSVKRLINYAYPYKAIILDEDGSITGKGPHSWATPYYKHHEHPECEHNETYYGGTICDNRVQVRRVAIGGAKPASVLSMQGLKVLRYDDEYIEEAGGNKTEYLLNKSAYGTINWKEKSDPGNGWAPSLVTGKKYKIHFGQTGIDFEQMSFYMSERWEEWDHPIYLVHNWTDVRQAIDVEVGTGMSSSGTKGFYLVPNDTIAANKEDWRLGQNVVYNATEIRETHLILSPKNQSNNTYEEQHVRLTGHRCVGQCGEKINENVAKEDRVRYWNVSDDWPAGKVPEEGEDVHIEPGWSMVFNLNPSPVYKLIRVNGNLTFENTTDTHLRCKHLFVRAGELNIGTAEYPMEKNARLTLYGERNAETIVYDNAIEAGNKLIANVNKVRMYGKSRGWQLTRLTAPAPRGASELYVATGLDLGAGDRLGLLPTSYSPHALDDVFVSSYDNETGRVTVNSSLSYYHWGQATSTGPDYNGLDMRGEVLLLTRNVKIDAEDVESWGGQIITGDTIEVFDGVTTSRAGSTVMDNVEIFNCSQIDSEHAALRFESAATAYSSITNSTLHNGYGWGLSVVSSANILIANNNLFKFRPMGLVLSGARNVTVEGNVVSGIVERETLEYDSDHVVDKGGGYSICALDATPCSDIKVRNNIAAGVVYAGFVTIGHDCGVYDQMDGNVAHSVKGLKAGHGLYFKQAAGQTACTEYSHFAGYKCYYQGAFAYPDEVQVKMSHMTLVDNKLGFGAQVKKKTTEYEIKDDIVFNDIHVYGESEAPDCPQGGEGGYCHKYHKMAFFASQGTWMGKDMHITSSSALPPHGIISISSWSTTVKLHDVKFINFRAKTKLGMDQMAFQMHPGQSDFIPLQQFYDTTFINCETDAIALFFEPPQKWAIIKDCGEWPCTAPKNTIFSFRGNKFEGTQPAFAGDSFQLIPSTDQFSALVPNCAKYDIMNGYVCTGQEDLGILVFESEDEDRLDRSMQPIYSRLQGTAMNNKVNSMMDHVWDGFYQGQIRMSRFPILVYAPTGAVYDIVYTGSPSKKQKYTLTAQNENLEMIVRIAYPSAESRQILKDGKRVDMNQWDEDLQMYGEVSRRFCGENRYIGVKNILEFYLTRGCVLQIAPRDAIQTMVRMEWSMDEFFSGGGTTQFIDRVSGSLGIHASTIKVVSVYEGSLVVNYDMFIEEDDESADGDASSGSSTSAAEKLAAIKAKQIEAFSTGAMDLGAPITDVALKVVKNTPAADPSSDGSSTDSSSDSSTEEEEEPQSIITGGQVTSPGYPPVIFVLNRDTYFQPKLLRSKNADYDAKALRLAETLGNVTKACAGHPCALLKTPANTEIDPFFQTFDDKWSFWSVDNVASGQSEAQGIYLKKSVKVNDETDSNYGPGKPFTESDRVLLVADAQNGKVWHTGGEDRPILMAYDATDSGDGKVHLYIVKYENLAQMQAATASETVMLPLSNSSAYESKPSFDAVTWYGSIANSEITLYYEFKTSSNAVKLGKGTHGPDGTWKASETIVDVLYKSDKFSEKFNPMHKFIYQDETFYLTGGERMLNDVQLDFSVLLLDADMTPLATIPMDLPQEMNMEDILGNHTVPTLKRMSETVAVSFQHRNETEAGALEYTQFMYFVDLQQFLPKQRVVPAPKAPPKPENNSFVSQLLQRIVQVVQWVFRRR